MDGTLHPALPQPQAGSGFLCSVCCATSSYTPSLSCRLGCRVCTQDLSQAAQTSPRGCLIPRSRNLSGKGA
jgi:hypothetical protein